MVDENVKRG